LRRNLHRGETARVVCGGMGHFGHRCFADGHFGDKSVITYNTFVGSDFYVLFQKKVGFRLSVTVYGLASGQKNITCNITFEVQWNSPITITH